MPASTYTPEQRNHALTLYQTVGTAEAARQTGISHSSIKRWARQRGLVDQSNAEKTVAANQATRRLWAEFREQEADAAGEAAETLRAAALERRDDPKGTQHLAVAYAIFIDKAELLSGRATSRTETSAMADVDRELRAMIETFEDSQRDDTDA